MNWLEYEVVDSNKGSLTIRVKVRRWHPGFWVKAYRLIREQDCSRLESIYLTLKFLLCAE